MGNKQEPGKPGLQLWGGVECTINRVEGVYFEQLIRTGHRHRLSDFERFASLGIKALRHPILWEETAPDGTARADWSWADASLECLKKFAIKPVVGLIHHGSGPRATNLLDPEFPQRLSDYAAAVARRYPWIADYTPVNEPLTTARFSALYGHWYPHKHDDLSFARALLNQCRAVILSIRAIRQVNSSARLVQTDDLGKVFSSPRLSYQADFENERRWCTFDLLSGMVDRSHPMWSYFIWAGVQEPELEWFLDNSLAPGVIGINHYLSGERYLDENIQRYPEESHGTNGRDKYADVLAARVLRDGAAGPRALVMEAWSRYHLPIAITECHNGCTREEQLRWFLEVWQAADQCRKDGAEVLAVTAWSLLGAFDWNHLVTRNDGHYEPGVYDVRSSPPRPTALVEMMRNLAAGNTPEHPILKVLGWWKRPERFIYGFSVDENGDAISRGTSPDENSSARVRPVLITGGSTTLGQAFAHVCKARGIPCHVLSRQHLDIADRRSVHKALFTLQPWAIINAEGYERIDEAETHKSRCYRENTEGPALLAMECRQRDIRLVTFSNGQVFNGKKTGAYLESDPPDPINYYGMCKVETEERVLALMPSALVVRSGSLFGPWDEDNFVITAMRKLQRGEHFVAASDTMLSPTYVPDFVHMCLDLLIDGESGIWHLANVGVISWASLVERAALATGIPTNSLEKCPLRDLPLQAQRPANSALSSERALLLPSLEDALGRFVGETRINTNSEPIEDFPEMKSIRR